jgi:hypothetical protein
MLLNVCCACCSSVLQPQCSPYLLAEAPQLVATALEAHCISLHVLRTQPWQQEQEECTGIQQRQQQQQSM